MAKWRPVPDYEDIYEVSDAGQFKRLVDNALRNYRAGRAVSSKLTTRGYRSVALTKDGKVSHLLVHRLVAAAFIGPSNGLCVNHLNGDKTDNRAENLEWTTQSENIQHALKTGLFPTGERHHQCKVSDARIRTIRQLHKYGGGTGAEIARAYGLSKSTVCRYLKGAARAEAGI